MYDTPAVLLEKIRLGESSFLEFKEVRFAGAKIKGPGRDALADGFAAFANGHGGVFVLGVEDREHEVIGIPVKRLGQVAALVREICADSIDPPIENMVMDHVLLPTSTGEEVAVIKIDIPRSLSIHLSPGGYMHRVGDAKRVMSPAYLARMLQQRSQSRLVRFDEQIVEGATLDDLPSGFWERFRTGRTGDGREAMLSKLRMARADEGGTFRPTVSGVLMASADPRQWIPNAYVQAVAYRGTKIRTGDAGDPYQLDAADVTGPLDRQIVETCRFVAKNMKVAAHKEQGREDRPQYDMTAVFEAVVNAVAHRDYSIHGSKIRLRLFEDRLELYSPGGLPNSMGVESLPHLQSTRNEFIASLLAKCPMPDDVPRLATDRRTMMDKRGEGVPLILDNSKRLCGRDPEFRLIGDEELLLTIHAANPQSGAEP